MSSTIYKDTIFPACLLNCGAGISDGHSCHKADYPCFMCRKGIFHLLTLFCHRWECVFNNIKGCKSCCTGYRPTCKGASMF